MVSYSSAIKPLFPSILNGPLSSCHIKGRLIPYGEFLPRLRNYCFSLGFKKPNVIAHEKSADLNTVSADNTGLTLGGKRVACPDNDAIIILSTSVPYEPSWGVYCGLPRPLIHERPNQRTEGTISNFIAPYLVEYLYAQKHIYLACKNTGHYIVTLPSDLVSAESGSPGKNLKIHLDKIAESGKNGHFSPLFSSDSFVSFQLSEQFLNVLADNGFSWKAGKVQRIGKFLTAELFDFQDVRQADGSDYSEKTFVETLLPVMNRIVTNANPELLAAIIHLQSEFSEAVDTALRTVGESGSENLLCIAGLDIDIGAFRGRGKRFFVPWAAYWHQGGIQPAATDTQLEQDDLFVALMAQDRQCAAL